MKRDIRDGDLAVDDAPHPGGRSAGPGEPPDGEDQRPEDFAKFKTFRPHPNPAFSAEAPDFMAQQEWQKYYEHKDNQKKLDLGWTGKFIGHGVEKLGNIAFIVILICFLMIVGIEWHASKMDVAQREKTVSTLFSIITLSLGYLFGKTNSRDK